MHVCFILLGKVKGKFAVYVTIMAYDLNAMLIRDFNNCNNNTRIFLLPCLLLLILTGNCIILLPQSTMNPKIGFAMELYLFIDDVSSFLSHIVVLLFGEACLAHLIKESVLVPTLSLNLYNWQADTKLIYTAHWLNGPHRATRDTHQHQQCQDSALWANDCCEAQARVGKGWLSRQKALKLEALPRAYIKVGCHLPTNTTHRMFNFT